MFDVYNDMDFREHIARWMPNLRGLDPLRYQNYYAGVSHASGETKRRVPSMIPQKGKWGVSDESSLWPDPE